MSDHQQPFLSLTKDNFQIDFFRAGGKGGQNVNKRSTACRITHIQTGLSAECREHRTQFENKKEAFRKLAESKEFQAWLKLEVLKKDGLIRKVNEEVEKQMNPKNIKIEVQEEGKWKDYRL